jgi:hypothetical protein
MARRRSSDIRSHRNLGAGHLPNDLINPGLVRKQNVLDPVRKAHTSQGVYRPSNQWRNNTSHHSGGGTTDVRQRALLLAKHLPWLPQYNFARG